MKYFSKRVEQAPMDKQDKDTIMKTVNLAIEENIHLQQYSLEKGILSHNWKIAQGI